MNSKSELKAKRLHRLEAFAHYITAFVVFMKGLDKIETPGKTAYALIFMTIGVLIILGTIFHHRFERLLKHFKSYVFIFEAIVWGIVGYLYMKEGKTYVQYPCLFAAIGYFGVAIFLIIKAKPSIQH